MPVRQATVASRVGLHARPASLFVAEATKLGVPVTIQVGERPAVDARSSLSAGPQSSIFCSAAPRCIAMWSVLSLLISYCGSSFEALACAGI